MERTNMGDEKNRVDMSGEKPDAPARTPVAYEIKEGCLIAAGQQPAPSRRGKHVKVLDAVWDQILRTQPRFHAGIPPEMANEAFFLAVRAACKKLGLQQPPAKAMKAWRRKR
jgi:hypothetical protein